MPPSHRRLGRLIADEIGTCAAGDVEARLDTLRSLARRVPEDPAADLAAMKALGDATRHRIVRLLAASPDDLCVCEINQLVTVSDSAVSHALSDLADAGLVTREKRGTWRYYEATERAESILEALDSTREGSP